MPPMVRKLNHRAIKSLSNLGTREDSKLGNLGTREDSKLGNLAPREASNKPQRNAPRKEVFLKTANARDVTTADMQGQRPHNTPA